jgi:D-alanyl-D-alanine carboxypeptidase/D-alanyl-D-alanine-endopeptidase (penicillin-binding protein 4)
MKIVVAAVALDVLGEDFQYTTQLVGKVNGGAIEGDVFLVGGGDPLLTTATYPATESYPTFNFTRVEDLFDKLSALGINKIAGSIVADESRYDDERFTPTLGLGIKGTEVGPLGALMINDGVVTGNPIKLDHPGLAAATELTNLFRNNGIAVSGEPKIGTAPTDMSVIAEIQSVTLPGVLAEMLTNSDNNSADLLLKEIGFVATGQGTRIAGIETMKAKLVEWGIALDGIEITDGSGLDRGNRLTCSAVSALLLRDGGFGPVGLGLAVAGRTGTLRDVLTDSVATERLRGKTGTLSGAKALSGFIPYADGLASTFSLIMNGSNVSNQTTYRPIWNALADALGGFDGSPTAEELAPKAP